MLLVCAFCNPSLCEHSSKPEINVLLHASNQSIVNPLPLPWWGIIGLLLGLGIIIALVIRLALLRRALDRVQAHLAHAPMVIAEIDPDHRVSYINVDNPDFYLGKEAWQFANPEHREGFQAVLDEVLRTGEPRAYQARLSGHQLRNRWHTIIVSPIKRGRKITSLSFMSRDITQRKQAQIILEGRSQVLESLARGATLPEVLELIAHKVQEAYPDILCSILLLDAENKRLVRGAAPSLPDFYVQGIDGMEIGPQAGLCGSAAHYARRVIVRDIEAFAGHTAYRDLALQAGLRACWSEPVMSTSGEVLGVLAMYSREPRLPDHDDLEFIKTTAHMTSIAIEGAYSRQMLQATFESVKRAKQEWESTVDSLSHFVALLDSQQRVLRVNRTLEDWSLGDVRQVKGVSVGSLFHELVGDVPFQQLLDKAWGRLAQGRNATFEFEDVTLGRWLWVQLHPISLGAYRTDDVLESYAVIVVSDITQQKQFERNKLETETARVQVMMEHQVLGMRQDFVASVSHEFRTPLTVIKSSKDIIQRYYERMTPEQRETHFLQIDDQVRLLTEMVDQVLFISQSMENHQPLELDTFDLVAFCRDMVEDATEFLDSPIPVRFEAEAQFDTVQMNQRLLRQIIINLISNAVKFSPEHAEVRVRLYREAHFAVIAIQDHGIGIPADEQKRLFDPFYRATNARDYTGTGLGLTVVKNAVDMHGGELRLQSAPGQGTTVFVRLPLQRQAQTGGASISQPVADA
jgi:signal transduction histidine kinase/putative methionine-R-sulfoxide reductase with GAF domain